MKIAVCFVLFMILMPVRVHAHVLFEHRETTYLSRDVTFERNRQVTANGFLDVHILTVPLNDPYISISPVESARELGLRETTQQLLTDAGAIAGTNADFFGMSGTHNMAFGPVIADGRLLSVTRDYNQQFNEFASFFIDQHGTPMIRYITPRIWFTVNGIENMRVLSINKVSSMNNPVIITRDGMMHTAQLSARFQNLRKVVVEDGIITGVGAHPLVVPENGFVVVMDEATFNRYLPQNWIGMTAHFDVFSNLEREFDELITAVGGGGLILRGGQIVHDQGTAIAGRHPRSALGISPCWTRLILMTVDGRGHSIGATHEDMASLMLRYGAVEAMHLDGGGSATMVAQLDGRHVAPRVVNRVSDGAQRRVVNALGIFDNSTPGEVTELVLMPYSRYVTRGSALHLHVYGLDLYRHRIGLDPSLLTFSAYTLDAFGQMAPATGTWHSNTYLPDRTGALYIRAQYGELSVSKMYIVQDIVALRFSVPSLSTMVDMPVPLSITGTTAAGASTVITPDRGYLQFMVTPPELGQIVDHVFVPSGGVGLGFITAFMGGAYVHLPIAVNDFAQTVDPTEFFADFAVQTHTDYIDPIRTEMTAVVPGNAFDFYVGLPGGGNFAYSFRPEGPAAVLQMSAAQGGIFATDRSQWGRFLNDINMMFPNFVIIRMDVNPLNTLSRDELYLFHQALRTQQDMGRMVFVISNVESSERISIRDGIRYIDLGRAGYDSYVVFRVIGEQVWYDF